MRSTVEATWAPMNPERMALPNALPHPPKIGFEIDSEMPGALHEPEEARPRGSRPGLSK
jgi:hypothetical protein